MALHINLYHEVHKQEEQRRRDPFKLAGLGVILIFLAFVCYYFYRTEVVHRVEAQLSDLQAAWAKLEPQATAAQTREAGLLTQQKANEALIDRLQSRFYWAPFLGQIASVAPRNVQIMSLAGDLTARKGPVNVLLTGIAAGQQPRTAAEAFRLSLQQKMATSFYGVSATFDSNSLEDSPEVIQLDGQALATATFKIRLHFFLDAKSAAPPVPTSTAPTRKSRHETE
jgi:Tfp pilus assembly protein PilN